MTHDPALCSASCACCARAHGETPAVATSMPLSPRARLIAAAAAATRCDRCGTRTDDEPLVLGCPNHTSRPSKPRRGRGRR